jgi:hypothetical protein
MLFVALLVAAAGYGVWRLATDDEKPAPAPAPAPVQPAIPAKVGVALSQIRADLARLKLDAAKAAQAAKWRAYREGLVRGARAAAARLAVQPIAPPPVTVDLARNELDEAFARDLQIDEDDEDPTVFEYGGTTED